MKSSVVNVKTPVKPWRASGGVENHGSEERRRMVAVLVEQVGHIWKICAQGVAQDFNMVELRISSSQKSSV